RLSGPAAMPRGRSTSAAGCVGLTPARPHHSVSSLWISGDRLPGYTPAMPQLIRGPRLAALHTAQPGPFCLPRRLRFVLAGAVSEVPMLTGRNAHGLEGPARAEVLDQAEADPGPSALDMRLTAQVETEGGFQAVHT